MARLREVIYKTAREHQPLTVRQLFYRMVAQQMIDKTQNEYNNVVVRLTGLMREAKELPFEWLVDNTRWMRKPTTYSGLAQMLEYSQQTYRRSLWDSQHAYVEIWCESDSVAGILYDITEEFDVPLMPVSGQSSKSFLHAAACSMSAFHSDMPCHVYYFGDYDKSGLDIGDRIDRDLRRYLDPCVDFSFERVAINQDQIATYSLPTRPPKKKNERCTETVELEAMTTADLQQICRESIEQHIDWRALKQMRLVEEEERSTLLQIAQDYQNG